MMIAPTIERVTQQQVRLPTDAETAGATIVRTRPTLDAGGREAADRPDIRVARLEAEVRKMAERARAREHALEHLSGAVLTLRHANRALTEENSLLRLELERHMQSGARP